MQSSAIAAVILSCVLAGTTVLSAQLGDVARKEEERRKTVKSSGKTYTNDNIKPAPPSSSAPASSGTEPASESAAAVPPATSSSAAPPAPPRVSADPAERKKEEALWRQRVTSARQALERAQTFADALQSKLNALNTDFVNRDDPAQRTKVAADRDKALADLERAKKEAAQHTKAINDIQQEARRAGVPAGWVR